MNTINSLQSHFQVTVRHKFPIAVKPPKWLAICPSCGLCSPYKRRVKGVACKRCCDTFHDGKWHASCVLTYKPFEN